MEFDESDAVKYMRENVDVAIAEKYDDDELLNLIDIIYDYYEANGLLDIDLEDEDDELDIDDLRGYVERMLRKDRGAKLIATDASALIEAYLDYENSLD